jgi:hypothetical protein
MEILINSNFKKIIRIVNVETNPRLCNNLINEIYV